jgi:2-polyprenyl-3-methyl-5-hydroxy-6-metoxy-1,4-benzoquinol methylase
VNKTVKKFALKIPYIKRIYQNIVQMRSQIYLLERDAKEIGDNKRVKYMDGYVASSPSIQNVVDIFKDDWTSTLPFEGITSGERAHFSHDVRVLECDKIVSVSGKSVLELGPYEGYHSYWLEKLGAASITSIESNRTSYLKCLIVKDILKLKVELQLGNFLEYMQNCAERYDIVLACGVLYHMDDPIKLIQDMSNITDTLFLWTHYYSSERTDINALYGFSNPILLHGKYSAYQWNYPDVSYHAGGSASYCLWLEKNVICDVLTDCGFRNISIISDDCEHERGSNILLVARR